MPNTIGKFDYEVTKMGKDDPIPFDPFIRLCLKSYGGTTRDGAPTLSANLMTEHEIDDYVTLLKADLDALASTAKRALANAREGTYKVASARNTK